MPRTSVFLRVITATFRRFASRCSRIPAEYEGQDMVEYALVSLLLGLGCVAMLRGCGSGVSSAVNSVLYSLSSVL